MVFNVFPEVIVAVKVNVSDVSTNTSLLAGTVTVAVV